MTLGCSSHILTSLLHSLYHRHTPTDPPSSQKHQRPLTHGTTLTIAEVVTNTMTPQTHNSHAAYDRAASMVAGLDKHLSSGPTCPEDKRAIEKAMAILTRTHSALGNRIKAWEANGQRVQAVLQTLNSELQKVRDAEGVLSHDIKHHRAFISLLARRITTHGQDDVAAPLPPGSIEAEIRQMERFKLINDLAVAGENLARMNMNRRRLKRVGSKLSMQIAEGRKAAKDILERAKAERATEILLGEDLIRRTRRAEEFGCVIEAARMAEDEKIWEEEVGEEYGKSAGSREQDAENGARERGEVQAGPNQ